MVPFVKDWTTDNGYRCLVGLHPYGFYCGYVVIPGGSKLEGQQDLGFLSNHLPSAHGGVTLADFEEVESEKVFLIGFDCGHSRDYIPALNLGLPRNFRSLEFVVETVNRMAEEVEQLEATVDYLLPGPYG